MGLDTECMAVSCEYYPGIGPDTEMRPELAVVVDIIRETTSGFTRLIGGLNYTTGFLSNSSSGQQEPPRYLFSALGYTRGLMGLDPQIDGLLYAEAEGERPSGAFSVLRIATWVRDNRRPTGSPARIEEFLFERTLRDVEAPDQYPWGIPVSRTTEIILLEPHLGDLSVGGTYGHIQDRKAVNKLAVPEDLRELLVGAVEEYHRGLSTTG